MSKQPSSIACPRCGSRSHIKYQSGVGPNRVTEAMRVVKRNRECTKCELMFSTTEIDSAELAELRRRAHLFERHVGSATP